MKKFVLATVALTSCLLFAGTSVHAQQFKIASVDMSKVFSEYYKTKKAEGDLKERAAACEKELRDQEAELKKLSEQIKKLQEDADNPAFTAEKKSDTRKQIESKTSEGRIKAQQLNEMVQNRKKELDEQRNRSRTQLVDEITKQIQEKAKKDGYSMVVDKTGLTLSGVSPFIYVQDALDITADVIKMINSGAGAAAASGAKDAKK